MSIKRLTTEIDQLKYVFPSFDQEAFHPQLIKSSKNVQRK